MESNTAENQHPLEGEDIANAVPEEDQQSSAPDTTVEEATENPSSNITQNDQVLPNTEEDNLQPKNSFNVYD